MAKIKKFLHSALGLFLTGVFDFGLAFLVFLRASDTGSLQQYGIMFLLIFLGLNRFVRVIRVLRRGQTKAS